MTFTLAMRAELDPAGVKSGAAEARGELDRLGATASKVSAGQDQLAAASDRVAAAQTRQAAAAKAAAVNAQNAGLRSAASAQLATHEVTNLSYQMNDIATMLASGQSPFVMMAQQGMQVSQIMGRRGLGQILPALGAGLASLITPTTLFLAAITAGGYAATAMYRAIRGEVVDLGEAMDRLDDTVSSIEERYDAAAAAAKRFTEAGSAPTRVEDILELRARRAELQGLLEDSLDDLSARILNLTRGPNSRGLTPDLKAEFRELNDLLGEGRITASEFAARIADIRMRSDLTDKAKHLADRLLEASRETRQLEGGLQGVEAAMDGIANSADRVFERSSRVMDALRELERLAKPDETPQQEIERIYDEGIGHVQTTGQVEALNAWRQAALDALAAKEEEEAFLQRYAGSIPQDRPNPEAIDPREAPAARLIASQQEQLAQTRLEIELVGRSAQVRAEATALLEAELRIREMAIDAQSAEANTIRDNARALAEVRLELERQSDAWSTVERGASRTINSIVDKLTAGDIEGALEALARDTASMLNELAIANPIKNALLGQNNPTLSDLGGIGGIIGRLLGRGDGTSPADMVSSALGQSVGAMNVSAATVIVNGSVVGGAAGDVARLLNPANGNRPGNPFLDLIGRAEGTDRGRGYDESLGYGAFTGGPRDLTSMTLDQIDALQGRMLAHPDNHFNSSALGRYQIVRRTLRGLRGEMGLSGDELFDPSMQDRLATHLMGRRGNSVAGLRNEWEGLRNVDAGEITAAFEKSTRAVTGFAGQVDQSIGGLANLTQGFEHLGGGFSDLARQLAGAGARGGGSLLQKLFGGVGGLARSWSISPAATSFIAGGGAGLFGDGGWTGPGGKYDPKGIVHADEFVFSAEATRSIGVANLEALHRAAKHGFADGGFAGPGPAVSAQFGGANIVNIHNYSSARITETETEDGRGGRRTELVIEDQIGGMISRTGSAPQRAMRQTFGLRNAVTRR